MTWDNVIGYVPVTPYFTAKNCRTFAPHGNWQTLDLTLRQMGKLKPFLELADITKFPINNLYPCSSGWGSNGATSHQGYAVYKVMAEKFGLKKPWEQKGRRY